MANPRITGVLTGFVILGLLMTGMAVWFADMAGMADDYDSYNSTDFNRTQIDKYNKLAEIQNLTEEMREDVEDANAGTGSTFDVVGSFFSNAYTAVKTFFKSSSYGYDIANAAAEDMVDVGADAELIQTTTTSANIILVIIFTGIALFIIFKVAV